MSEQRCANQTNIDIYVFQAYTPNIIIEKVKEINSVNNFFKMVVNTMNTYTSFVDSDKMKADGAPKLFHNLCVIFLLGNSNFAVECALAAL